MQGKITKVLNMKPQEILGMVEEAAGTRMFEERKDKALKTMTKKDKKVDEIKSVSLACLGMTSKTHAHISCCGRRLTQSWRSCARKNGLT